MLNISLCMIVKNEEKRIGECIKHAAPFVDDVVVVDTGSKDGTKKAALSEGARVFDFMWINDFAAARNYAAAQAKHDWVLSLDADELVTVIDIPAVEAFLDDERGVGAVLIRNYTDNKGAVFSERVSRLYNRRHCEYEGRIHEQLISTRSIALQIKDIPFEVDHIGYRKDVMEEKGTFERNKRMLEAALQENKHNTYYLFQLGKTYFAVGMYEEAAGYFERMLSLKPNPALAYVYTAVECYGYALINTGQYEKSKAVLEYEGYYSQKAPYRFMLGHVYQNNGRFSDALEMFESCVGKDEEGSEGIGSYLSYYNIGVILEVAGFPENARAYYRQCGDYEPAKARLGGLK